MLRGFSDQDLLRPESKCQPGLQFPLSCQACVNSWHSFPPVVELMVAASSRAAGECLMSTSF